MSRIAAHRLRSFLAFALLLSGCETELKNDLREEEANEIVLALSERDIAATKERDGRRGRGARYTVKVAESDVVRALGLLKDRGLPSPTKPGVPELFDASSLVPSAIEERARYAAAISGELARSIEDIDGVVQARVHLVVPDAHPFALDEIPRPRASVFVKFAPGEAAFDPSPVRALVAGATEGVSAEDVIVVAVPARTTAPSKPSLVRFGPIAVSRESATAFRAIFAGTLALNALLALCLVVLVLRLRTLRAAGS